MAPGLSTSPVTVTELGLLGITNRSPGSKTMSRSGRICSTVGSASITIRPTGFVERSVSTKLAKVCEATPRDRDPDVPPLVKAVARVFSSS